MTSWSLPTRTSTLKGKETGQGIEEPHVYARCSLLPPSGHTGTKQVGEGSHILLETKMPGMAGTVTPTNTHLNQKQLLAELESPPQTTARQREG